MKSKYRNIRPIEYFSLTFLLSWLIWIPLDLSHFGIGALNIPEGISNILRLLGVLMPAVAAMILTGRNAGRQATRSLLSRLAIWQVGWKWWLAAGVIQPALLVLSGLVYNYFDGNPPVSSIPFDTFALLVVNIVFLLIATLGEEIGWRGVALPSLQAKHNPIISSLILGLLWGIWHIPFWLLLDSFDQFGIQYFALNLLLGFPLTFFITWIFNHTRSSLLMPVVIHITFNIVNTIFMPVTANIQAFSILIVMEWIFILAVLIGMSAKKTMRKGVDQP